MGNKGKLRKSVLYKFKDLSDSELINSYVIGMTEYNKIIKAGKVANDILAKYGYFYGHEFDNNFRGYDFGKELRNKNIGLGLCIKFRNLEVPFIECSYEVCDNDIIDRLYEVCWDECRWIDKHCYLFDISDYDNECESGYKDIGEFSLGVLNSDKKQEETCLFFDTIVEKEFNVKPKKRVLSDVNKLRVML